MATPDLIGPAVALFVSAALGGFFCGIAVMMRRVGEAEQTAADMLGEVVVCRAQLATLADDMAEAARRAAENEKPMPASATALHHFVEQAERAESISVLDRAGRKQRNAMRRRA